MLSVFNIQIFTVVCCELVSWSSGG